MLGKDTEIIPIDSEFDNETPFSEVILSLAESIIHQIQHSEKFILFGHSMGAVLAYETAKVLSERIIPFQIGIVLSGMLPPSREIFSKLDSELDREKAKNYSADLGMNTLSMLPDKYLDAVIEKMNSDNLLLKRYENCCDIKLSIPTAVIYSEQEQILGDITQWAEKFTGDIEYIKVTGNHFYLINDFSEVKKALVNVRRKLVTA
jgi:surfactin synthase thioesterase subunit